MAIGSFEHSEFHGSYDVTTTAYVERLTPASVTCHLPHPSLRVTSADGTVLLYVGLYGETRQLYAMNLSTGISVQLTSGRGLCEYEGICLDADDRHALYAQGGTLWCVDLSTLLRSRVYGCESGWMIQCFSLSGDGQTVVLTETEQTSVPANLDQPDWSYFALSTIALPHSRLTVVNRASNTSQCIRDERCWLGRASLRPHFEDTILYCHEGPYDYIDARMWLIKTDGSDVRCVREKQPQEIVVGEHWLPDGSGISYLHRESTTEVERPVDIDRVPQHREGVPGLSMRNEGEASIRVVNYETLEEHIVMPCHPYAHLAYAANGQWCTGDTANGPIPLHLQGDEEDMDDESSDETASHSCDDFIYLGDVCHGREVRLCHHATSWRAKFGTTQDTHPHPTFSADGRFVYFVSDRDGHPAVYRAYLARFLWEHNAGMGLVEQGDEGLPDSTWGFPATFAQRT